MKSRKLLVLLLVFIALIFSVGSVGAYMRKQTSVVSNVLEPAKVTCEVLESFEGRVEKTSVQIKNTSNIEAYLRLSFVTYWVDSHGDITFKTSPKLEVSFNTTDWVKVGAIYYYKYPVQPGDDTKNILTKKITLQEDKSDGTRQVVEVFAEAIQSKPTTAVIESWGVAVDTNGYITTP